MLYSILAMPIYELMGPFTRPSQLESLEYCQKQTFLFFPLIQTDVAALL